MDNFDLRKYLAEGKLNENLQIDDIFGEYVAQWSQGNYDYDFADLKSGSVKGSLVDDFTLGPDEYDDDEYVRDYKMMKDYLLKNRSYKLSQDEKEGLSQFPVQFTLDDDGETIKADIYYSPEYLAMVDADLDEQVKNPLTENADQDDAVNSLREIGDEIEELSEEARDIVRRFFPNELSRLDGYGVFNMVYSNNRYDVTLGKFIDRLEEGDYDDLDDEDYVNESISLSDYNEEVEFVVDGGIRLYPSRVKDVMYYVHNNWMGGNISAEEAMKKISKYLKP